MKKQKVNAKIINSTLILFFMICGILFTNLKIYAIDSKLNIGFTAGATIPSDKLSSFYDQNEISLNNGNSATLGKNILSTGYNVGIKLNLPMSEDFELFGSILVNRFPENEIVVKDNNDPDKIFATLIEYNNLIPIEVGFNLNIIDAKIAKIYTVGNLSYNFLYQSIDIKNKSSQDLALPSGLTETNLNSRIGGGAGLGIKFDLKLITLALETKFNRSNLIFKTDNEFNRDYYNINLFLFF